MSEIVSVIIPVYNAGKYLRPCIDSVLNQSYKDVEVILVNDGSKDDSLEICKEYEKKYSNIHVLNQENKGVSAARKQGVDVALGEWICFVDADDTIPQDSIKKLFAKKDGADIVVGVVSFEGPSTWPYKPLNKKINGKQFASYLILKKIHSGPVAKLYKRALFSKESFSFPRTITCGEDFLMNLDLSNRIETAILTDDFVYNYIYREGSASVNSPFSKLSYVRKFNRLVYQKVRPIQNQLFFVFFFSIIRRYFLYFKLNVKNYSKKLSLVKKG